MTTSSEAGGDRAATRPRPNAALLGNGKWQTLVTPAGVSVSRWQGYAPTRARFDRVEARQGWFLTLRDAETGEVFPLLPNAVDLFAPDESVPGRFVARTRGLDLTIQVGIAIHPDRPIELHRVRIEDLRGRPRRLELTSGVEIALDRPAAEAAHPAFSRLFVQTEAEGEVLLARRRPRGRDEHHPWLAHAALGGKPAGFETDREIWLGRHGTPHEAATRSLPGITGNVLDPVFVLRREVAIEAHDTATVTFALAGGEDREGALEAARCVRGDIEVETAFELAATRARAAHQALGLDEAAIANLDRIACAMALDEPWVRATAEVLARAAGAPDLLKPFGVDPARWLVLATVDDEEDRDRVDDVERAIHHWRNYGLPVDGLVLVDRSHTPKHSESLCVLARSHIPEKEFDLLFATARCVYEHARRPIEPKAPRERVSLADQETPPEGVRPTALGRGGASRVARMAERRERQGRFRPKPEPGPAPPERSGSHPLGQPTPDGSKVTESHEPALDHFNGFGGFDPSSEEYVVRLAPLSGAANVATPAPWVNVIANPDFGFLVSETGAACTWSDNSREHRLTPWSNDAVLDPHDQAFYVRDDQTGEFWSPLAGPTPDDGVYEMRHGFGTSLGRHESGGLLQETRFFAALDEPLQVVRIRLVNREPRLRTISLVAFQRIVLGDTPEETSRHVVTDRDEVAGALLARAPVGRTPSPRVAFAAALPEGQVLGASWSGDREEFLGPGGTPADPDALRSGEPLDGRLGAGLDPCFAQRVTLAIPAWDEVICSFVLGVANDVGEVRERLERLRAPGAIDERLERVRAFWRERVGALQVRTPSPAVDRMVNGWLLYQALSCRLWGRTAFQQSGGAFGFRDQLQDSSAFLLVEPERARDQILLHAAHQFVEGDVLHWWHPPDGRGLRTRFADDRLWLPWLIAEYVGATGDAAILDVRVPFLRARQLEEGEDEAYLVPDPAGETADVYEHACRAVDVSLDTGAHGLPLMGTGDWNDGMNRVGREGRGESVWMAFFLSAVIDTFAPLAERRGDTARAARWRAHRSALAAAVEREAWDGAWYLRAWDDDGEPIGSHVNEECRIDALVQAWSVLSGVAPEARARRAMASAAGDLMSERDGIVRLLTPAFQHTRQDPGYIKGYVAGVRENGGQYTHAALWVVRALAEIGDRSGAARWLERLSPVDHAATVERASRYRAEPYVVAADVYGAPPHVGRGGWTWYTGSAAWMWRVAVETVLGLRVEDGRTLAIRPLIPDEWPGFEATLRLPWHPGTVAIQVTRSGAGDSVRSARLDGHPCPVVEGRARIGLPEGGGEHRIEVELGAARKAEEPGTMRRQDLEAGEVAPALPESRDAG